MVYDSMAAWDRNTFEFNDNIQRRGGVWHGKKAFNDAALRTYSHDDCEPPSSPASGHEAPSFNAAKSQWSPPPSPRTRSLRYSARSSPPTSPRVDSPTALNSPSSPPMTPQEKNALADKLFAAACAGDLQHIRLLLSLGAPINHPSLVPGLYDAFKPAKPGSLSALAGAAGNGQPSAVSLLLENGAALNPTMKQSSSSPLHQACKADDAELAHHLLEAGADVDSLNCYKVTPLMYAVKYGSTDLVSTILARHPDLHVLSFISTAAIHWAIWPGHEDVIELLLQAGANPDHRMGDGNTPLHCTALSGFTGAAETLLQYGADPLKRNEEWKTPLQVAVECGNVGVAEALKLAEMRRWR